MKEIMRLKQNQYFIDAYELLCKKGELTQKDKEYILGAAVLLLKIYNNDENKREYFELAYHIVLNYSIFTKDYEPLNDIAYNYGFFPIVRFINTKRLLNNISINEILYDCSLEKYKNGTYVETLEQNMTRKNLMKSNGDVCFIAPTSSGKSSIISNHIKNNEANKKSLVIVPSKSLLAQTYMEIRKNISDRKIICHDEMYNDEEKFVGVLTQERTMRLLENNKGIMIDYLYIDEAHNLFTNDSRNVLLARVIKQCILNNFNIKIMYLSPFINNVENLLLKEQDGFDTIGEQRISYNIKEPEIYELKKDGTRCVYNKFFNCFWNIDNGYDMYSYLNKMALEKNFVFIGSPKKIELFAKELFNNTLPIEETCEIIELKKTIEKYVHKSFLQIKMLEHGIIYLHAKIPDVLKDYLEYKFKTINSIRYLIANTVILEGINLPIDNLFILDARGQSNAKLLNLIGRVNRLNDVFDKDVGTLDKLLPTVHFINSKYYRGNMQNKIKNLYDEETDEVTNPLLLNCNVDSLKYSFDKKEKIKNKNNEILELEHIYSEETTDEITILKKKLMKNGMDQLISLKTENVSKILNRIKNYDLKQNMDKDVIDKVKELLVVDLEIIDRSFKRLKNDAAVRYYKRFINVSRRDNLSGQIESQLEFFKVQRKNGNNYMYIGQGFGECKGPYLSEANMGDVYIDLRTKTDEELVNLLIIKTKIEQDFLSYQYLRAVSFLRDVKIISKDEFNIEIYGTADEKKIDLLKLGITAGLLKILNSENQIKNIEKDQYGNIQGNAALKRFYMTSDDYTKFEIEKYIRIN